MSKKEQEQAKREIVNQRFIFLTSNAEVPSSTIEDLDVSNLNLSAKSPDL